MKNYNEIKELIQDLKNLDVILGKELSKLYYKYSRKSGELFVKMTELLEDIIKFETDNYTVETIYNIDYDYDIYEMIKQIEEIDDILILNEFDGETRELLLKCEAYLLKDNDKKQEYVPEPLLEHEYYKLLEVCFDANFTRIMDGLTLQKINGLSDSKDGDLLIEYIKKDNGEYYAIFKNEKGRIVCVGEHCQYSKKGLTDMDVHFLNGLQIKLLRANTIQEDYTKKLILMAGFGTWYNSSAAYPEVTKGRFIIEKNLDIETAKKWDCLLSYFSDNIDINIIKNREGLLELRIWKKGWKYQDKFLESADHIQDIENRLEQASRMCTTIALYHCYSKAREALLAIVADVEGCEIYGYMPKAHSYSNFRNFNNSTIIKTYNLQKIS